MNWRAIVTAASLLAFAAAGSATLAQIRIEGPRVDLDVPDRRPNPLTGADMVDLVGGVFALKDGYDRSRRGFLCALTYEDRNGNGRRDRGERPLPGWSFAIANAAGAAVAQGQSGADGRFCNERPLDPGAYTVRQTSAAGWANTEPGAASPDVKSVNLPPDRSVTLLFGNCQGDRCRRERRDGGELRGGPSTPAPQSLGQICVLKFNDLNGDGVRNPSTEALLPNWAFTVGGPSGTFTGQTDLNGSWCTPATLGPGVHTVTETMKPGWSATIAGATRTVTLTPGLLTTVLFGNRYNGGLTKVCAEKFNDLNGDGIRQGNEPPLAGWQFTVTSINQVEAQGVTNASGIYCSAVILPYGIYTVTETLQPGWTNTKPGGSSPSVSRNFNAGTGNTIEFGNRATPPPLSSTVCVKKFNDLNGDGVKQAAEPWLAGWTFNLAWPSGGGSSVLGPTGTSGAACFTSQMPAGSYTLSEVPQSGWTATTSGGASQTFALTPGSSITRTFGNKQAPPANPKVCVTKYNDLNGNGVRDTGEPVLAGWFFEVRNLSGAPMGFGTTNAQGVWCSNTIIPPGPATVAEQLQTGWINTDPGNTTAGNDPSKPVTLVAGQTVNLVFGNRVAPPPPPTGQICVAKYRDLDGNGAYTPGEPEVPYWNFSITGPSGPLTLNTGWAGVSCTPVSLLLGTYTVTEVVQPGWSNTDPGALSPQKTVNVAAGALSSNGQYTIFGNIHARPGQVCVNKYHDLNRNRSHDGNEPMLAGFTFEVRNGSGVVVATGVTDAQGRWCTTATLPPGTYSVTEVAKPGWVVTDPFGPPMLAPPYAKTTTVTAAHGGEVFFGNIRAGRVCIAKYNDLNGNGQRDAGEPPMAGVSFRLHYTGWWHINSVVLTTDTAGMACGDLPPGVNFQADELVPPGWIPTEPVPYGSNSNSNLWSHRVFSVVEGQTTNLVFGNHQPPPPTGRVCVVKYEDLDGDGQRDAGEPQLPGWTFDLGVNGAAALTSVAQGPACLLAPVGAYTMTEQPQVGWINTDPTGTPAKAYTILENQVVTVAFGNRRVPPPPGRVCVLKYIDTNGNGQRDAGEGVQPGVAFKVTDASGAIASQGTTNAQGEFCSPMTLPPGTYAIAETVPVGWASTDPGGLQPVEPVEVTPGQTATALFGNRQNPIPGEICAQKYNDLNGNGVRDAGEPALAGWQFTVRDGANAVIGQGTTNATGRWCLSTMVAPGTYSVSETMQSGWTSTDPGGSSPAKPAVVTSNQTVTLAFGNRTSAPAPQFSIQKIDNSAALACGPAGVNNPCVFRVRITNIGTAAYAGPAGFSDSMGVSSLPPAPNSMALISVGTPGWSCSSAGAPMTCAGPVSLAPGQSIDVVLTFNYGHPVRPTRNCVTLTAPVVLPEVCLAL